MRKTIMRKGSQVVEIRAYAPGDGHLSFVACFTEDCAGGRRTQATTPAPSRAECERALPAGWELYQNGPYWRARPITGRTTEGFGPQYEALQNSQDIAAALAHVDPANLTYPVGDYTGALVRMGDGEYLEVWVSVWGFPWSYKAAWERVL